MSELLQYETEKGHSGLDRVTYNGTHIIHTVSQ